MAQSDDKGEGRGGGCLGVKEPAGGRGQRVGERKEGKGRGGGGGGERGEGDIDKEGGEMGERGERGAHVGWRGVGWEGLDGSERRPSESW